MLPPNPHEFRQRDAVYRRGVLLGMTMAEIMILLLFCLLMAFVLRLEEYEDLEKKMARIDQITEVLERKVGSYDDTWEVLEALEKVASTIGLDALTEIVKSTAGKNESNPESVKTTLEASLKHFNAVKEEMTAATGEPPAAEQIAQEMNRQKEDAKQWRESATERQAYQALKSAVRQDSPGNEDPEEQAKSAAQVYGQLSQSFTEQTNNNPTASTLQEFLKTLLADAQAWRGSNEGDIGEKYVSTLAENRELTERVTLVEKALGKAKEQLSGKGQGLEYPSCFWTPEGKIQFVYYVEFDEQTVTLRELPVPGNEDLKSRIPFDQITVGQPVKIRDYLKESNAVYQWSVANECRFFVKIFDKTSKDNKSDYKVMVRQIESRFYKSELQSPLYPTPPKGDTETRA